VARCFGTIEASPQRLFARFLRVLGANAPGAGSAAIA